MDINEEDIYNLTPLCNCCRKRMTRIIMPHSGFNESGDYLFHCKLSGKITKVKSIEDVIKTGKQEPNT